MADAPRIAVDATPLLGQVTGIGGFVRSLLQAERDKANTVAFALSGRNSRGLPEAVPEGIKTATTPMPASFLLPRWKKHDFPKLEHLGVKADLVHGTNFVVPPTKAASVVTVHDMTAVRFPEFCTPDVLQYPALVQRAIDRGALVHTPTEAVADEVREYFTVDPASVRAIHHGLEPVPFAQRALTQITRGQDFILALGTVEPRKDYAMLVRAFNRVGSVHRRLSLVIAGALAWGADELQAAVAASPHADRIHVLGYVDSPTRYSLLHAARVFAFPSIYEGFGVPPLEAMRVGVPVVATAIPAVREVCGNAMLSVPVGNDEQFAQALQAALENDDVRSEAISRGHARAQRFSWTINHHRMRALYDEALARR